MKNMKNLIKLHNTKVLKNQEHSEKRSCNCRVKSHCPLDGKCVQKCVVYQANVATNNECKKVLEELKENLKCAIVIRPCHLDTKSV